MSAVLRAAGIALIALVALLALKGFSNGVGVLLRVGATVLLFGAAVFELSHGIAEIRALSFGIVGENSFVASALGVMLKALGIALVARVCSDICRDCGEGGLASGVETVAGVVIFSLSLPILKEILGFASELLSRGG
jgi:stage III sporulation protein AD